MVAFIDEILIFLNEAFEHVQNQLLIVVDEHSENTYNCQEYLIPLKIAHFDCGLLGLWNLNFKQGEQHGGVFLSSNFHHEGQRVYDFVSELVAVLVIALAAVGRALHLRFVLQHESQELDDVRLDVRVETNCS
jgi:hypothetical protein